MNSTSNEEEEEEFYHAVGSVSPQLSIISSEDHINYSIWKTFLYIRQNFQSKTEPSAFCQQVSCRDAKEIWQ